MRRMREPGFFRWHHVLFAVPAVALAFGIQYFMRKHHPESQNSAELSFVTRPSFFKGDSGPSAESQAARTVAAAQNAAKNAGKKTERAKGDWEVVDTDERKPAGKTTNARAIAKVKEQLTEPSESSGASEASGTITGGRASMVGVGAAAKPAVITTPSGHEAVKTQQFTTRTEHAERAEPAKTGVANDNAITAQVTPGTNGTCMTVEYRGDGPNSVITQKEWARTIDQFLEAKKDLSQWLEKHRKGFPEAVVNVMEKQLRAVKIQKPPVAEEPDLAWRGIGVWTLDTDRNPVIRLSPGFVKLANRQPERAKFEMTRLVAQSWAPCELQRHEALDAWNPLLSCLGVNEKTACGNGSYSEAGWAVSSTIAAIVAPPGCTVPAFAQPSLAQCLKKIPLPLNFAGNEAIKLLWNVARKESGR